MPGAKKADWWKLTKFVQGNLPSSSQRASEAQFPPSTPSDLASSRLFGPWASLITCTSYPYQTRSTRGETVTGGLPALERLVEHVDLLAGADAEVRLGHGGANR